MIGDVDDDSGEEEELESSTVDLPPPPPKVSLPRAPEIHQEPIAARDGGWTEHRSIRYKDEDHPKGYTYFFNPATGEARWAHGDPTSQKKRLKIDDRQDIYYPSPPLEVSEPEMRHLMELSDGHLKIVQGRFQYYCDQQKREKWAFQTDKVGLSLLCQMVKENQPALAVCRRHIEEAANSEAVLVEGRTIYTEKKHLIQGVEGHKKVTWSQDEYAHPGMQVK